MRTLKNLPVPQDGDNAKFPDGQIKNQSSTESGTPVVRELYGDIITNVYAILRDAGIEPTETEDSELTQYQLLDALKVFSNNLNDLQQILTVNANDINVTFNFDNLPENYVFIGKITDPILASENYTINSIGADSFPINSTLDISASSVVLVVLNQAGSQMFNLSSLINGVGDTINTPFGTPIAFNESKNMLYFSDGRIITDNPSSFAIQDSIRAFEANANINVLEVILHKKKLICFTIDSVTLAYKAYSFDEADLNTVEGQITLSVTGIVDNQPYMYCDGDFVYFTNTVATVNDSVDDYRIGKFLFDPLLLDLSLVAIFELENLFQKTTNVFINKLTTELFTFIAGELYKYDIGLSVREEIGFFNTIDGVVFKFNGKTYYSNGNVATKWNY